MSHNVGQFLATATQKLKTAGIPTARLDCLILLEDILGENRAALLAHPEWTISTVQYAKLNTFIIQREAHLPLAYIRGRSAFFGRDFAVNTAVLVPRPESEALIEIYKTITFLKAPHIADIGTGSGCLGITAALEQPGSRLDLFDISSDALTVAKQNAHTLGVDANAYQADLFTQPHAVYDVVFANLPYVPDNYTINQAAQHEPPLALFSGADGLDHFKRFWNQIRSSASKPTHIITEAFPSQHKAITKLADAANYHLVEARDFAQHFRLEQTPLT